MGEMFSSDEALRIAGTMAAEAMALLPPEAKADAALAFQAVMLSHCGRSGEAASKLRRLGSMEPYACYLEARCEMDVAEALDFSDPLKRKHLLRVRRVLRSYDPSGRPLEEADAAFFMNARADFLLGHRKGIFMGVMEIPEDGKPDGEALAAARPRGMKLSSVSSYAAAFSAADGSRFCISLENPGYAVVCAVAGSSDALGTAAAFIKMVHAAMRAFTSPSFFINGTMLSSSDIGEAMADLRGDAFPVWFFARGSESREDDGTYTLRAQGAEAFGVRTLEIRNVGEELKEEAAAALSLLIVYQVFSPGARRHRSFDIGEHTYALSEVSGGIAAYTVS